MTTQTRARHVLPDAIATARRGFPAVSIRLHPSGEGEIVAQRSKPRGLRELSAPPLVSYESSRKPESPLRRAFDAAKLPLQLAMTAHDADLIKTYVRAGIGVGIFAEIAVTPAETDRQVLPAPAELPECTPWAVLPHGRSRQGGANRTAC